MLTPVPLVAGQKWTALETILDDIVMKAIGIKLFTIDYEYIPLKEREGT